MDILDLTHYEGFDWDHGNQNKNLSKHGVTQSECEQIFFNRPLLLEDDLQHSKVKPRFLALGKTDQSRKLFMAFTTRKHLIRVISAREMSKKERNIYEKIETHS